MRTFGAVTAVLSLSARWDLAKCHSERSEESLFVFWKVLRKGNESEMFRFVQHDSVIHEAAHLNLKT
jgi:hypothetical protein